VGRLEDRLGEFFCELRHRAAEDSARAERSRLEREQREREQQRELERRRVREIERARTERLLRDAGDWRRAQDVRAYLRALRDRLDELSGSERERIAVWVEWGEARVARMDSVQKTELIEGLDDGGSSG
jgi:hypothetical protein